MAAVGVMVRLRLPPSLVYCCLLLFLWFLCVLSLSLLHCLCVCECVCQCVTLHPLLLSVTRLLLSINLHTCNQSANQALGVHVPQLFTDVFAISGCQCGVKLQLFSSLLSCLFIGFIMCLPVPQVHLLSRCQLHHMF